jgi:2-dehydro-3-deoxyglucarate aldolase/4-hydroxy-2-oxoheptanedioate aldolase
MTFGAGHHHHHAADHGTPPAELALRFGRIDRAASDMEHTGWGMDTVRMLLATARATYMVPIVRVTAAEYHFIARVLDLGAAGVMVPMVESCEQARWIVESAKYPPEGRRGAAFGVAHDDYTGGDIVTKMQAAIREQLLIAQIETARGVENVAEVAAVDGIDVLWVGHFDLTNSLGIPGQFTHPSFLGAVGRVLDACREHGKISGFMASDAEAGRALLAQGFRILAYGGDLWPYQQALRQGVEAHRAAAGGAG